jgi:hypothetical protein
MSPPFLSKNPSCNIRRSGCSSFESPPQALSESDPSTHPSPPLPHGKIVDTEVQVVEVHVCRMLSMRELRPGPTQTPLLSQGLLSLGGAREREAGCFKLALQGRAVLKAVR